jgi:hypothetical protein
MKIKIKRNIAGRFEDNGFSYQAGDVVAVPDELAKDLIQAGHAETVKPAPRITVKKRTKANG